MACVTSIQENIIEKHHTEEEGVQVENNADIFKSTTWPEMPFKTPCPIPTREKKIEVLLEIPLREYTVTATAPGLHLPLETITEKLRNFGLVQIFNQKLERSGKRIQTLK